MLTKYLMKYCVVTTFNAAGYEKYGKRMIQTFLRTWPKDVQLVVYAEKCTVREHAPNLLIHDLELASPELMAFKNTWRNVPKANGDVSDDPARSQRKDAGKGFKWDAVRFAHKVYSIFHCAKNTPCDWLLWMDADTICHSAITQSDLDRLCPSLVDLCFLGRARKYTECGLYAMKLASPTIQSFLQKFQDAAGRTGTGAQLQRPLPARVRAHALHHPGRGRRGGSDAGRRQHAAAHADALRHSARGVHDAG